MDRWPHCVSRFGSFGNGGVQHQPKARLAVMMMPFHSTTVSWMMTKRISKHTASIHDVIIKMTACMYVNITEDEVVNEAFHGNLCLETNVHTIFRDACRSDCAWRPWTLRALQFSWPLQNVCRLCRTNRTELQASGFGAGCSSHFSEGCHVWAGTKVPGHRLACCNLADKN